MRPYSVWIWLRSQLCSQGECVEEGAFTVGMGGDKEAAVTGNDQINSSNKLATSETGPTMCSGRGVPCFL